MVILFGIDSKLYIVRCPTPNSAIYPKKDILHGCKTQIHKLKKHADNHNTRNLASFSCYLVWYVTSAKRNAPITLDDAKTLWKIHKKTTKCTGHKWHPISRRSGKNSGFECEGGYKYSKKRPIVSRMTKNTRQDHGNQSGLLVAYH